MTILNPLVATNKHVFNRDEALSSFNASLNVLARRYSAYAGKRIETLGVTNTMAWPLVMLGRLGDGTKLRVLANTLCIEDPSLVRTVDQLAEAGLVERKDDLHDRRAKALYLTPKGRVICKQVEAEFKTLRTEIYADVSDEDMRACLRVLDAMTQQLGISMPDITGDSVNESRSQEQ